MPGVAGGAPGSSRDPPGRPGPNPRAPLLASKKTNPKLSNLKTSFSGPRLAIFMVFFRVFYGSLLRSHCFPYLRASWYRF